MDARHDLVQFLVYLLTRPGDTHRVLRHLQTGGGDTTRIDSLARGEELTGSDELIDGISSASHVADLSDTQRLVGKNLVGIVTVQLVLRSTRQVDVRFLLPWFLTLEELAARELVGIRLADVIA